MAYSSPDLDNIHTDSDVLKWIAHRMQAIDASIATLGKDLLHDMQISRVTNIMLLDLSICSMDDTHLIQLFKNTGSCVLRYKIAQLKRDNQWLLKQFFIILIDPYVYVQRDFGSNISFGYIGGNLPSPDKDISILDLIGAIISYMDDATALNVLLLGDYHQVMYNNWSADSGQGCPIKRAIQTRLAYLDSKAELDKKNGVTSI